MKTLALFDFDKTLYLRDSMIEFTKFTHGKTRFYTGMVMLLPYLVSMKLGFYSAENTKKKYLSYFFKNWNYSHFCEFGNQFASNEIEKNLSPEIFQNFKSHLLKNHTVVIVTASLPEWIKTWSDKFQVKIIGTQIEVKNNKFTGNFLSPNCNGSEKLTRIYKKINPDEFDCIKVYGNGKGDKEMLRLEKKQA